MLSSMQNPAHYCVESEGVSMSYSLCVRIKAKDDLLLKSQTTTMFDFTLNNTRLAVRMYV